MLSGVLMHHAKIAAYFRNGSEAGRLNASTKFLRNGYCEFATDADCRHTPRRQVKTLRAQIGPNDHSALPLRSQNGHAKWLTLFNWSRSSAG